MSRVDMSTYRSAARHGSPRAPTALAIILGAVSSSSLMVACDDSSSSQTPRVLEPPEHDLSGSWRVDITTSNVACDVIEIPASMTEFCDITQNENDLTLAFWESFGSTDALISASTVIKDTPLQFHGEDVQVDFEGAINADGSQVEGTARWHAKDYPSLCHGDSGVLARRLVPPTVELSGTWVGPLWDENEEIRSFAAFEVTQDGPRLDGSYGLTRSEDGGLECAGLAGMVEAEQFYGDGLGFEELTATLDGQGHLVGTFVDTQASGHFELQPAELFDMQIAEQLSWTQSNLLAITYDGDSLWGMGVENGVVHVCDLSAPQQPSCTPLDFGGNQFSALVDFTFADQELWLTDPISEKLYRFDLAGVFQGEVEAPPDVQGLAFDGTYRWLRTGSEVIQVDDDGSILSSFHTLGYGTGLAYDGVDLYYGAWQCYSEHLGANGSAYRIYRVQPDGTLVAMYTSPGELGVIGGLAYDGTSSWVIDQGDIGSDEPPTILRLVEE